MAQMVKNPPAMQETRVQSLGWEDPLEKGMASHSSILAWRIPYTEEPGGLQSMRWQRVRHNWAIFTFHTQFIVARHSNYLPSTTLLTCSCLHLICFNWASLVAQLVKNLPAMVPLSLWECWGHRSSKSVDLAKLPSTLSDGVPDASPPSNHHHGGKVMTSLFVHVSRSVVSDSLRPHGL